MITIQYFHEEEYMDDEYFPGARAEMFFNDESTIVDILSSTFKLLKFAGYPLPSEKTLEELKKELEYQGLLRE